MKLAIDTTLPTKYRFSRVRRSFRNEGGSYHGRRILLAFSSFRKLFDNLTHRLLRFLNFIRRERNCADYSVTATTVAFANGCDVVAARAWRPRIRTDGNLGALQSASQCDCVSRLRKQIIRNEFIEAFVTFVDQIELHDILVRSCLAFNCIECFAMKFQNWCEATLHLIAGRDFT